LVEGQTESDRCLLLEIKAIWGKFRGIYGAPRIWQELREQGWQVSQKRVARKPSFGVKRHVNGAPSPRNPTRVTQSDPSHAFAANLLNRQFDGQQRHQVWLMLCCLQRLRPEKSIDIVS
jgi:putative transposase